MQIKLYVDHPQKRVKDPRLNITAAGEEFDGAAGFSNTFRDPVSGCIMLRPRFDHPDWYNSNTAPYDKLALSSVTVGSGNWEEQEIPSAGAGPWLATKDTAGGRIYTTSYSKNRGIILSAYNYGGNETSSYIPLLTFGYGTQSSTSDLYFELYPDGIIDIYRDGELYKSGTISSTQEDQQSKNKGTFFDIMVLPYLHNQILFYSKNGGSFSIQIDEILYSDTNPTISPATSVFVEIPNERRAKIQLAPAKFFTSGTALSEKLNFFQPPLSTQSLETWDNFSWVGVQSSRIYGYPAYVSTQTATAAPRDYSDNAFVNNGSNTEVKLKLTLGSSSEAYTPFVLGGQIAYGGDDQLTYDGTREITEWCQTVSLDVPDDPANVTLSFNMVDIGIAATYVPNLTTQLYRPIKMTDNYGNELFDGLITHLGYRLDNNNYTLSVEARDKFQLLDDYVYRERVPLAGELFTNTVNFLGLGVANSTQIGVTTFRLPFAPASKLEDMGPICNVGDTARGKLEEVINTYAGNWIYGFYPNNIWIVDQIGNFSGHAALAESRTQAVANGLASTHVYFNLSRDLIRPEATEVRVTGRNPVQDTLFQYYKRDEALEDASLAPNLRPDGWVGHPLIYGIIDPQITSETAGIQACNLIFDRLSKQRRLFEWDGFVLYDAGLYPLWRGDTVTLVGIGSVVIRALRMEFKKDNLDRCSYTGELLV